MRRPRQAPELVARPVPESAAESAWDRATPEQRAFASAAVDALRRDLAAALGKRRAANL